jgi:RNA recognition motif-containing protein
MVKEFEGQKAMKALDGSDQMGRAIIVSPAQKDANGKKVEQGPRQWKKGPKVKKEDIVYGK